MLTYCVHLVCIFPLTFSLTFCLIKCYTNFEHFVNPLEVSSKIPCIEQEAL
jgi:hypothetical protein